jgi:hypothetical protein
MGRLEEQINDLIYDENSRRRIKEVIGAVPDEGDLDPVGEAGFFSWFITKADYLDAYDILRKPWHYGPQKQIYEIAQAVGLDTDDSLWTLVDYLTDKFNPNKTDEELSWSKREPKNYPSKEWDAWSQEGDDKGYDF